MHGTPFAGPVNDTPFVAVITGSSRSMFTEAIRLTLGSDRVLGWSVNDGELTLNRQLEPGSTPLPAPLTGPDVALLAYRWLCGQTWPRLPDGQEQRKRDLQRGWAITAMTGPTAFRVHALWISNPE